MKALVPRKTRLLPDLNMRGVLEPFRSIGRIWGNICLITLKQFAFSWNGPKNLLQRSNLTSYRSDHRNSHSPASARIGDLRPMAVAFPSTPNKNSGTRGELQGRCSFVTTQALTIS